MIFKTITDETTLSGQKIVGALQARKIAQQQATAQLEIDIACLKEYQVACQNGTVTTEQFDAIMHKASASAVEYSAKVKAGTGTAQSYANAQRATNSALQEVSIGAGIASKPYQSFSVSKTEYLSSSPKLDKRAESTRRNHTTMQNPVMVSPQCYAGHPAETKDSTLCRM